MNRLLFDGTAMQSTSTAKFHGGAEYTKFLFRELIKRNCYFDVIIDVNRKIDREIVELLETKLNGKIFKIITKSEIYTLASSENYDIFFSAHPYEYNDFSGTSKFIGVIHGIRSIELPWDTYKYKFYKSPIKRILAKILGKSSFFISYWRKRHINKILSLLSIKDAEFITVSNHSKFSLLNIFNFLKSDQIKVFYSPFSLMNGVKSHQEIPYFLLISGNRYEKNVWRAVLAFDKLFSDKRLDGFKVIITGSGDKRIWDKIKNKSKFELKDYVSYSELGNLYANAFAFVYPSLNEGFGYPPLYAMGLDIPVIASSSTSIPEICGAGVSYFSPTSIDDLCSRILRVVNDDVYRKELMKAGSERVAFLLEQQEQTIDKLIKYLFT